MSDLKTAAKCSECVQPVCLSFPLSNVSDISSDPGLAALNGTSFYVSDINFLSNEALAWRGLATFVRIVDRYIGE